MFGEKAADRNSTAVVSRQTVSFLRVNRQLFRLVVESMVIRRTPWAHSHKGLQYSAPDSWCSAHD